MASRVLGPGPLSAKTAIRFRTQNLAHFGVKEYTATASLLWVVGDVVGGVQPRKVALSVEHCVNVQKVKLPFLRKVNPSMLSSKLETHRDLRGFQISVSPSFTHKVNLLRALLADG